MGGSQRLMTPDASALASCSSHGRCEVTRHTQPWDTERVLEKVAEIDDLADVACFLDLSASELEWFVDPQHGAVGPVRHVFSIIGSAIGSLPVVRFVFLRRPSWSSRACSVSAR